MADRKFQKKKRNNITRKKRPIMTFTGEGKNKTEKQYFLSFQEQHGKYSIQYVNTGLDTDPAGMLKSMENAWKRYELSVSNGDKAYIVLDMDCSLQKIKLVKKLQETSKNIQFIVSNPCIEVWFIMHFIYTTHQFKDGREPKKELGKYISGYEENMYISEIIRPRLEMAVKNVEKLMVHYESIGIKWGDAACNPMTDVVDILKELDVI